MKKLLAMLLAVCLVMSLNVSALAIRGGSSGEMGSVEVITAQNEDGTGRFGSAVAVFDE